jgi:hypothetical protein
MHGGWYAIVFWFFGLSVASQTTSRLLGSERRLGRPIRQMMHRARNHTLSRNSRRIQAYYLRLLATHQIPRWRRLGSRFRVKAEESRWSLPQPPLRRDWTRLGSRMRTEPSPHGYQAMETDKESTCPYPRLDKAPARCENAGLGRATCHPGQATTKTCRSHRQDVEREPIRYAAAAAAAANKMCRTNQHASCRWATFHLRQVIGSSAFAESRKLCENSSGE